MLFVNRPWGYGSVGRAMRSQRIGHEFESRYLHQKKERNQLAFFFLVKILIIAIPTNRLAFGGCLQPLALCTVCIVADTLRRCAVYFYSSLCRAAHVIFCFDNIRKPYKNVGFFSCLFHINNFISL